jgi:hypothetical protein
MQGHRRFRQDEGALAQFLTSKKRREYEALPAPKEQESGSGRSGPLLKRFRDARNGQKRNDGTVRTKPRRAGSGRSRFCATAAAGGRHCVRHAQVIGVTAAHCAAGGTDSCTRQEKK